MLLPPPTHLPVREADQVRPWIEPKPPRPQIIYVQPQMAHIPWQTAHSHQMNSEIARPALPALSVANLARDRASEHTRTLPLGRITIHDVMVATGISLFFGTVATSILALLASAQQWQLAWQYILIFGLLVTLLTAHLIYTKQYGQLSISERIATDAPPVKAPRTTSKGPTTVSFDGGIKRTADNHHLTRLMVNMDIDTVIAIGKLRDGLEAGREITQASMCRIKPAVMTQGEYKKAFDALVTKNLYDDKRRKLTYRGMEVIAGYPPTGELRQFVEQIKGVS